MTYPRDDDSSVQTPPRQGHTPDHNINIPLRPPFTGEGPSGGDVPPIPATESPPLILGCGHYNRPPIQSHHRSSAIGRGPLPAPSLGYVADPSVIFCDGFVLQIGSHGERNGGGRRRKRTQEGAAGAGSSRVVEDHNPIPPPPPPQLGTFGCIVCKNQFRSDRSLSGHMRTHNDRDWRGTNYPPPTFSMQEFYDDDNARAHLNSPLIDEEDGVSRVVVDQPLGLEENGQLNESAHHELNPPSVVLQVVQGPISFVDQTGKELEEGEILGGDIDRYIRNVGPPPPDLDINKDLNYPEEQYSKVDMIGPSNLKKSELPDLNKDPPPDCD